MLSSIYEVPSLLNLVAIVFLFLTFLISLKIFFKVVGSSTAISWLLIGGAVLFFCLNLAYNFLYTIYNFEAAKNFTSYLNFFSSLLFVLGSIIMAITLERVMPKIKKEPSMYKKIIKGQKK